MESERERVPDLSSRKAIAGQNDAEVFTVLQWYICTY